MTPEYFTVLGGMLNLNIFMLMRTITQDGAVHSCHLHTNKNGGNGLVQCHDDARSPPSPKVIRCCGL